MDTPIVTAFTGRVTSSPDGNEAQSTSDSTTLNALTLEELCAEYYTYVFRRIYSLVRDVHRAEELTQTTFEKVTRYYPRIKHHNNIKAWLYITATRAVYDSSRYNKPCQEILSYDVIDGDGNKVEIEERCTLLEDRVADQELRMQALSKLNEQARDLLIRYYINGEPVENLKRVYQARRYLVEIYERLLKRCEVAA